MTQASLENVRQQIDANNYEMVNILTQQMGTVITPLMENTNNACNALAVQIGRLNRTLGVVAPEGNQNANQGPRVKDPPQSDQPQGQN